MKQSTDNVFRLRSPGNNSGVLLLDESLETKTAGICDLFVSLEPNGMQLALKERKRNRFLAIEVFSSNEKTETEQWPVLLEMAASNSRLIRNFAYSKTLVTVYNPFYTLVPSVLFHAGDEKTYLPFNFQVPPDLLLFSQAVQAFQLHTVYGISGALFRELQHLFKDFSMFHHARCLLEMVSLTLRAGAGKHMHLNIRQSGFDAIVTDGKKLLLMNSFSCQAIEDFLYYTLFILEQLELNPENVPVQLSGDVENESAVFKLLSSYIHHLRIMDRPPAAEYSYVFQELPTAAFLPLFSLSLCES